MNEKPLLLAAILLLNPCLSQAESLTVTDDNSSLKFTRDDPRVQSR